MKILKTLILIGLVVSFYNIQICYGHGPSVSLGTFLINLLTENYFSSEIILFLASNIMFLLWYRFNKRYISLIFIILPLSIWLFWKKTYSGILMMIFLSNHPSPF